MPYPSFYDPTGGRCSPSTARCPERDPEHGRHRRAGPGRRQRHRRGPQPADPRRPGRGTCRSDALLDLGRLVRATRRSTARCCWRSRWRWSPGWSRSSRPCVVPLLPGYLSYATGLSGADLEPTPSAAGWSPARCCSCSASPSSSSRSARCSAASATGCSSYQRQITSCSASLTILLGLVFLGVVPWLQRDVRVHRVPAVGLAAAPLLGVLFGLGWTPCIGPTLAAVTDLALQRGHAPAAARCSACLLPRPRPAVHRRRAGLPPDARRGGVGAAPPGVGHRVGGVMLIVVGLLLVTGLWDVWSTGSATWVVPGFEAGV